MQAENRQADIAVDRETLEKTFKHIDISRLSGETVERAKKVKFLVLDIDGVCTNGQLYINPRGETTKTFHVHDGIGIKTAFMAGIGVGIITGRKDTCVEARMRPLGVTEFFCGYYSKLEPLAELARNQRISYEEMAYLGDDIIDLDPLLGVGLPCAVANAREEVKNVASVVTKTRGGEGAVRELVEILLACQEKSPAALYWIHHNG